VSGFSFRKLASVGKTYSFAIFGLCGGCNELQMCMAFSVGILFYI